MSGPILWLGFVIGLRHSLEADHVAAVASLSTRTSRLGDTIRVAGAWGFGHAAMLLLVGGAVGALGLRFPPSAGPWLEAAAGGLLVLLGLDVLRRLRHRHEGHTHSTISTTLIPRALLVGGMHGMAGSAALVVAVVPVLPSPGVVLAYLALFGAGSILGMVLCSLALSVPLRLSLRSHSGVRGLQLAVGTASVVLGCWVGVKAVWG
jgi:hypothetical protein